MIWLPVREEWQTKKYPNWSAHIGWGVGAPLVAFLIGLPLGWALCGMLTFSMLWEICLAIRRTGPRARVIDLLTWVTGTVVAGLVVVIWG